MYTDSRSIHSMGSTYLSQSAATLNLSVPIVPQLYRILRQRIIQKNLSPGTKLTEANLAQEYGISRQPIREVFIRLAGDGLLEVRPQRGTFVASIDFSAVLQARFIREAVEADIVAVLARESDARLIADLREQLAWQEKMVERPRAQFMKVDEQFHRTLAIAAGREKAWSYIEGLKSQMDRVRFLSLKYFCPGKFVAQHKFIVDSIEKADVPAAVLTMRQHLRELLDDLPKIYQENADFFENYTHNFSESLPNQLDETFVKREASD